MSRSKARSSSGLSRRKFLATGLAGGAAGAAVAANPFGGLQALAAAGRRPDRADRGSGGYGQLRAKKPAVTPTFSPEYGGVYADGNSEWLALPDDFEYVVLGLAGTTMSDGNRTPQSHDGMGAFAASGVGCGWCATTRTATRHRRACRPSPDRTAPTIPSAPAATPPSS